MIGILGFKKLKIRNTFEKIIIEYIHVLFQIKIEDS